MPQSATMNGTRSEGRVVPVLGQMCIISFSSFRLVMSQKSKTTAYKIGILPNFLKNKQTTSKQIPHKKQTEKNN